MKKIFITIGIIFLVFLGLFSYFRSSPYYSLFKINQAFHSHNLQSAEKYIDINNLSEQFGNEVIAAAKENMQKNLKPSDDPWENFGQNLGQSLIESLLPSLSVNLKEQFRTSFENSIKDTKNTNNQNTNNLPSFNNLTLKDLLPGGKLKLTPDKTDYLLTLNNNSKDKIIFRMKKEKGVWQIKSWENLKDTAANYMSDTSTEKNQTKVRTAKFGDRIDLFEGWFLTVSTPEDYTPKNEYSQPEAGNKYISIEVLYENNGTTLGTFDSNNFELQDNASHRFKKIYSDAKQPELDNGNLPANQKVRGFITYETPKDSTGFSVIYTSSYVGTITISQ